MLTVERDLGSETCIVRLSGDIEAFTVPAIREAVDGAISGGCRRIVLDLSEVDYIDSSALGFLVWADHRLQPFAGTLTLAGARRDVVRILELSGLVEVAPSVEVAGSVEAALAELTPPPDEAECLWTRSFEVVGDARLLAEARSRIVEILGPLGLPDSAVFDIKVAAGEALANAVRHGSPQGALDMIGVEVSAYDDRVEVSVSDRGRGFDGAAPASDDVFAPGGRGVLFMRALMDAVEFMSATGGGTCVRLAKRRLQSAGSAA